MVSCIAKNLIKHQPFVYAHTNDQTVLFQTIQFSISHLFALSLNDWYAIKPITWGQMILPFKHRW